MTSELVSSHLKAYKEFKSFTSERKSCTKGLLRMRLELAEGLARISPERKSTESASLAWLLDKNKIHEVVT